MTSEEREMMAPMQQAVADAAADVEYGQSYLGLTARLAKAQSLLGADSHPDYDARLHAEIAAVSAKLAALAAAVPAPSTTWTRDETIARRASFNAAVKALPKVGSAKAYVALVASLPYSVDALKDAVKAHNL